MLHSFFEKYFSTLAALTVLSNFTKYYPALHINDVKNYTFVFMSILRSFRSSTFAKNSCFLAGLVSKVFAMKMSLRQKGKVNYCYCNVIIEIIAIKRSIFV